MIPWNHNYSISPSDKSVNNKNKQEEITLFSGGNGIRKRWKNENERD
jgi:hypothetical protein